MIGSSSIQPATRCGSSFAVFRSVAVHQGVQVTWRSRIERIRLTTPIPSGALGALPWRALTLQGAHHPHFPLLFLRHSAARGETAPAQELFKTLLPGFECRYLQKTWPLSVRGSEASDPCLLKDSIGSLVIDPDRHQSTLCECTRLWWRLCGGQATTSHQCLPPRHVASTGEPTCLSSEKSRGEKSRREGC